MSSKSFDRLGILTKKSVISLTVVIILALWFTCSQYFNYEEYYYQNVAAAIVRSRTALPASSDIETTNTTDISIYPTNTPTDISDSATTVHLLIQTIASNDDVWFRKLVQLTDIHQSENNIFFIETSCGTEELKKTNTKNGVIHLNPRQCCAVESVALTNRNRSVYVLHTCPLNLTIYKQSPEYIKQTLANPNVHIIYLRLDEIFKGSPVESLYLTNKLASSKYPIEHLSDILRHLVLWKFGGTYLDLDTINIRPLDDLQSNYAGWQDGGTIANGVMNFKYEGAGHDIVTECLKELNAGFDGSQWGANGPQLVTRILLKMCNFTTVTQMANEKCDSFTVLPPVYFYPIYYPSYGIFFQKADSEKVPSMFNGTYNIHFWNKMSSQSVIEVGTNQLYGILADEYCHGVYRTCGKYF